MTHEHSPLYALYDAIHAALDGQITLSAGGAMVPIESVMPATPRYPFVLFTVSARPLHNLTDETYECQGYFGVHSTADTLDDVLIIKQQLIALLTHETFSISGWGCGQGESDLQETDFHADANPTRLRGTLAVKWPVTYWPTL